MSIRNLDALFAPTAIALVGASNRPGSVGAVIAGNLVDGGFPGPVMTVNPHETAIRSMINYRSVSELPITPDLAVVCTPPEAVPGVIADLGDRGCRAAIVITAGFGEGGREPGRELRQAMLAAARPHLLRIVGPNCLGFLSPRAGLNASFAHLAPKPGDIAFLTQSGAVATAMLDWATSRSIGFSHIASLGAMSDVDFGDLLDYLAFDAGTRAILLYVEAITHARKFLSAARTASRTRPVVVVKSGRSEAGARAAMSHTGALAGSDAVYDAAFRRAGMLRVDTLDELFHAAGTLASGQRPQGDRLAILTNGGGVGVLAVDELAARGGVLADLSEQTVARLDAALPPAWSRANPLDILGDADGTRYTAAIEALLEDGACDAVLAMNCPTAVADSLQAARAITDSLAGGTSKPLLACWLGDSAAAEARRHFSASGVPSFETPEQAVRAFTHLTRHRRNQELLMQTPPSPSGASAADFARARALVDKATADGRTVLTEPEAKALLDACGIATVPSPVATDPEGAADLAASFAGPVVLKILSRDISHKSDVGGVQLGLASPQAVLEAAREMRTSIGRVMPGARLDGFTVQPMIRRPGAHELIAGIAPDPVFGPVVLFGHGGTAVEVIGDRSIGLPPLNPLLARDMIEFTRIGRLLRGYRNRPPADVDAIAATLIRLGELAAELDRIAEIDINPLIADPSGVIALDARVVLTASGQQHGALAIRPYPRNLEQEMETRSGLRLAVRPVRPDDEDRMVDMLRRSSSEDVRLRFFAPIKAFNHDFAARLTQIDYDREMALVAIDTRSGEFNGAVRLISDPDNEAAEFAIMVRTDCKGLGIGFALMTLILRYARGRGIQRVFGDVLISNTAMLDLATRLGFARSAQVRDVNVVTVELKLDRSGAASPG